MNGILTQAQGDMLMGQGNQDAMGRATTAGILGAAEGILTAPDLMSGLGSGFGGFNRGYNSSLVANRPKVTPLADGAFSQVTMPDGSTKIIGNQQVADFLQNKWKLQGDTAMQKILLGGQVRTDADADIQRRKNLVTLAGGEDASPDFNPAISADLAKVDRLFKWYTTADADTIAGINSPVASNAYNRTIGRLLGTPEYAMLRDFDSYIGQSLLDRAEKMSGALSNNDLIFLKGIEPKTDDPTSKKIEYLQEYAKRVKAGEERRSRAARELRNLNGPRANQASPTAPQGPRSPSGSAPASTPTTVPGLSPRASQYFTE